MPKNSQNIEKMQRIKAALDEFQRGSSMEDASKRAGVTVRELEDAFRLQFNSNVEDLATAIATELEKTTPEDVQKISKWLRETMIWMFNPDADLVAEARVSINFSDSGK